MAEGDNQVVDALLSAIRADEKWDHDFTPSPYDPWYIAASLARPENLAELREASDHPVVGRYAQRALERLAEAADLDHDDEPKDAIDIAEARAGHHRRVLDDAHAEPAARREAAQALTDLHRPESAKPVLAYLLGERSVPRSLSTIAWLASHPDSDALLAFGASIDATFEIVRRRRCAGLTTRAGGVREQVIAVLLAPMPRDADPEAREEQQLRCAMEYAALLVVELGIDDDECADALAAAVGPPSGLAPGRGHGPFSELRRALATLGDRGRRAVDRALAGSSGAQAERLAVMREALATAPPAALDISDADVRYLDGFIESASLGLSAAYGIYADVLRQDPTNRHAAFQLAWIDRAFGSPITPSRIDWLRSLRVSNFPFLRELEEAVPHVVPGPRLADHRVVGNASPRFGERAWAAGLPSIAALYYQGYACRRQRELTKTQAAAQVDRFWR